MAFSADEENDMAEYNRRILVVEDNTLISEGVASVLMRVGYQVDQAGNGLEALGKLVQRQYDVIIADYHMPKMDGLQLLAVCQIVWPAIPVLMVSAEEMEYAEAAQRMGAYAWMCKPYDATRLLRTVRTALEQPRLPSDLADLDQRFSEP
jgi:DNA-binding NtrC family response regulator